MRVLIISQDYSPSRGGVQTYTEQLAIGLRSLSHKVLVLAPGIGRTEAVWRFPIWNNSWFGIALFMCLPWVLYRFKPDKIIHMQWSTSLASSIYFSGKKICLVHGRELIRFPFMQRLVRWTLRKQDYWVANSKSVQKLALQFIGNSVANSVIYPGVNVQKYFPTDKREARFQLGLSNESFIVLNITRQVPRKNTHGLISAFNLLASDNDTIELYIGGTGSESEAIQELIQSSKHAERIHWMGEMSEAMLPLWYSAADLFVMPVQMIPGDVEGFGMVFLESAACGTPSLSTRIGGIPEAIEDGLTGVIIEPNQPEDLYQALQSLVSNRSYCLCLGDAAYHRAHQQFRWEICVRKYQKLLDI